MEISLNIGVITGIIGMVFSVLFFFKKERESLELNHPSEIGVINNNRSFFVVPAVFFIASYIMVLQTKSPNLFGLIENIISLLIASLCYLILVRIYKKTELVGTAKFILIENRFFYSLFAVYVIIGAIAFV